MELRKGMPGLRKAGKVANERLTTHLANYGYAPCARTLLLWKNATRPITFTLCVDDFGIKYVGKQHVDHLLNALRDMYTITCDWKGELYLGLTIKWNYANGRVSISMPGYIAAVLLRFQHPIPTRPQHSPHACSRITYGKAPQAPTKDDTSPQLPPAGVLRVQQVVGCILYYALAVDSTFLVALSDLGSEQSRATTDTQDAIVWLLNYAATHPDAILTYVASDMCLHAHSDASYLSVPRARSRSGGHFFFGDKPTQGISPSATIINGAIHVVCQIIKSVMGSAAEAEIGAGYINARELLPIRVAAIEMGHPQLPTPIQVDNSTAVGFTNKTIKQKMSKAIDMRFY